MYVRYLRPDVRCDVISALTLAVGWWLSGLPRVTHGLIEKVIVPVIFVALPFEGLQVTLGSACFSRFLSRWCSLGAVL